MSTQTQTAPRTQKRADGTRTAAAKLETARRRQIRRDNARYGFRTEGVNR